MNKANVENEIGGTMRVVTLAMCFASLLFGCKSAADCKASPGCSEQGTCAAKGSKCIAGNDWDCYQSVACGEHGRCAAKDGECVPGGTPPADSKVARARSEEEKAKLKAAHDARLATYRAWTPAQRISSAERSGADLTKNLDPMGELVESAANTEEGNRVATAFRRARASALLRRAKDGASLEKEVGQAVAFLEGVSIADIRASAQTSYGEAMKDPGPCRGKWFEAKGQILRISKAGDLFEGQIALPGFKFVYFVTPGKTEGLVEDSRATFVGLFAQQYTYENMMGGQTTAALLVGHFKGQGMDGGTKSAARRPQPAPAKPGGCNCPPGDLACDMACRAQ
jgi:hypothetical protein